MAYQSMLVDLGILIILVIQTIQIQRLSEKLKKLREEI